MCGKDTWLGSMQMASAGSPPHVRERLLKYAEKLEMHGITPACAGKTAWVKAAYSSWRDHPRMCGKDIRVSAGIFTRSGSPPHVRERLNAAVSMIQPARITPACAGKTDTVHSDIIRQEDHPRMCGKDLIKISAPQSLAGITPACAGKTAQEGNDDDEFWDHPRMCGKDTIKVENLATPVGSPPHVRERH